MNDGEMDERKSLSKILGDLFNCKWKNISSSCSSNNFIIERPYQELQKT